MTGGEWIRYRCSNKIYWGEFRCDPSNTRAHDQCSTSSCKNRAHSEECEPLRGTGDTANVVGNVTPAADYNIRCDLVAARICFRSGLPIEIVGWELCRSEATFTEAEIQHYKKDIGSILSKFTIDCNAFPLTTNQMWFGDPGLGLPDPVEIAIAIDPSRCTKLTNSHVEIACEGTFARGMIVVDKLNVTVNTTAKVVMWTRVNQDATTPVKGCWELDIAGWKSFLKKCVRSPVK